MSSRSSSLTAPSSSSPTRACPRPASRSPSSSLPSRSPEARRAYLQWLSSGRKAPHANIGYVFLFFYGLERRVFVDAKTDQAAAGDIPIIIAEVERLLSIYGKNNSFNNYASRFVDFLRQGQILARRYQKAPPAPLPYGYEMPVELRIGLGQLAADKQPMPADWALACPGGLAHRQPALGDGWTLG